jgi:hypothetical protein
MPTPGDTKPSSPASSPTPRPSFGRSCPARKPSSDAALTLPCHLPTAPKYRSLFFDDRLDAKVREFNPCYAEAEGALLGQFRHLHTDIYGNRADRPQHASGCGGSLYLDGFPVRDA